MAVDGNSLINDLRDWIVYEELREYFIAICIFTTFELVFSKTRGQLLSVSDWVYKNAKKLEYR